MRNLTASKELSTCKTSKTFLLALKGLELKDLFTELRFEISSSALPSQEYDTGCKEGWFYGLPFGQVFASMYKPKSLLSSPKMFLMSSTDYSSSVS